MNFTGFNLNPLIVEGVERAGYSAPTPIQSAAIPVIMSGCDLLAGARTGTGKTAAFALPLLHKIMRHHGVAAVETKKRLTTLVLVPTRELAQQVNDSFKTYAKGSDFRSAVVYGGVGIKPQIDQINKGIDLLVATPGRLLDLSKKRAVNLSSIDVLVFDEADRMLDMGFKDEIRAVMSKLPKSTPEAKTRPTLLCSATLNDKM